MQNILEDYGGKMDGLCIGPEDTRNLDKTIAQFVLPGLKLYKKLYDCIPCEIEDRDQWDEILDKMIYSFDYYASGQRFEIDFSTYSMDELKAHRNKIQEGLDLFAKYYRSLWW